MSAELVKELVKDLEEDHLTTLSLKEKWRDFLIGLLIIAVYLGILRGDEVVNMMLGDLRRFYGESKQHTIPHVALLFIGRFKREIGELYHIVIIVEKTRSGIIIRPWVLRVISYWEGLWITSVFFSFRSEKEEKGKGIKYEPYILDIISRIQDRNPRAVSGREIKIHE